MEDKNYIHFLNQACLCTRNSKSCKNCSTNASDAYIHLEQSYPKANAQELLLLAISMKQVYQVLGVLNNTQININSWKGRSGNYPESAWTIEATPLNTVLAMSNLENDISTEIIVKILLQHPELHINTTQDDEKEFEHPVFVSMVYNKEFLPFLLKHPDIDINFQSPTGISFLHEAVRQNQVNLLSLLLEHDNLIVNPVSREEDGAESPLHWAAKGSNLTILELLLDHPNIHKNIQDVNGFTPLHASINNSHSSNANSVLSKQNLRIIERLLQEPEVHVNAQEMRGYTALHLAVIGRRLDIIELLLKHSNIDMQIKSYTQQQTQLQDIKYLNSYYDMTAHQLAFSLGYDEIIHVLSSL